MFFLLQILSKFTAKKLQDHSNGVIALEERVQTYTDYLGESMKYIHGVRECPVGRMTLCVTSEIELEKCVKMKVLINNYISICVSIIYVIQGLILFAYRLQ